MRTKSFFILLVTAFTLVGCTVNVSKRPRRPVVVKPPVVVRPQPPVVVRPPVVKLRPMHKVLPQVANKAGQYYILVRRKAIKNALGRLRSRMLNRRNTLHNQKRFISIMRSFNHEARTMGKSVIRPKKRTKIFNSFISRVNNSVR